MTAFKGWKTLSFGALMVVLPPLLAFLGTIDWNDSGLPAWAISLIGIFIMILRTVTTTPAGRSAAIFLAFCGLGISLSACSGVVPIVGSAVVAGAIAASTSAQTLSTVAKAGCAAQAAANAAEAIAAQAGSLSWAQEFSDASTIAGYACAW